MKEVVISIPSPTEREVAQAINNLIEGSGGYVDSELFIDLDLSDTDIKEAISHRMCLIEEDLEGTDDYDDYSDGDIYFPSVSDPSVIIVQLCKYFNCESEKDPNILILYYYICLADLEQFINILKESN